MARDIIRVAFTNDDTVPANLVFSSASGTAPPDLKGVKPGATEIATLTAHAAEADSKASYTFDAAITPQDFGRLTVSCEAVGARQAITLLPTVLPDGAVGVAYKQTISTDGGTAPITISLTGSLPPGLTFNKETGVLSGTPTTAGSYKVAIQAQDATGAIGYQAYALAIGTGFVEQRTAALIQGFMAHRADLLTSQEPNLSRGFGRLGVPASSGEGGQGFQPLGGGAPFNLGFSGGEDRGPATMMFATSLQQILQANRAAKTGKAGDGPMALGAASSTVSTPAVNPSFDLWVEAHATHFDDDGTSSDGTVGLIYVGADYLLAPGILAGAIVQLDHTEEHSSANQSEISGRGWMAGPYIAARLTSHLYFDARAAWGRSENSVSPLGTYSDQFDTERWLARANLTGNWDVGQWRFTPGASVARFEEQQDAYIDSNAIPIASHTTVLSRLTFGPEIAYRFRASDGTMIEPQVVVQGIWDFDSDDDSTVDGIVVSDDDLRARVQLGVSFSAPTGGTLRASGAVDGLGDGNFEAYSGQLWVNMPFD